MKRASELSKSDARRERIESNGSKENITLPRLFKRDKGVCHICKGKCDYNDYEIKGNVFYAKDNYPSRDHVIPLSKGGTHTWDNVKLARMRCNTIKRNHTSIVIDKGRSHSRMEHPRPYSPAITHRGAGSCFAERDTVCGVGAVCHSQTKRDGQIS